MVQAHKLMNPNGKKAFSYVLKFQEYHDQSPPGVLGCIRFVIGDVLESKPSLVPGTRLLDSGFRTRLESPSLHS